MERDAIGEASRKRAGGGGVQLKDDLFLGMGGTIKERWL